MIYHCVVYDSYCNSLSLFWHILCIVAVQFWCQHFVAPLGHCGTGLYIRAMVVTLCLYSCLHASWQSQGCMKTLSCCKVLCTLVSAQPCLWQSHCICAGLSHPLSRSVTTLHFLCSVRQNLQMLQIFQCPNFSTGWCENDHKQCKHYIQSCACACIHWYQPQLCHNLLGIVVATLRPSDNQKLGFCISL